MAVDGSLIFNTKIDTKGFEKGVSGLSSKTIDLKNKISDTQKEISNITKELEKMADTPIKTDVAVKLEKDVEKAKSKLNELYAQADNIGNGVQSSLSDMGFDNKYLDSMLEQNGEWQKIQTEITKAEATLNNYQKELNSVNAAESKVTGKDTAEYSRKSQKVSELTGKLNVYKAKLNETEKKENSTSAKTKNVTKAFSSFKNIIIKAGKALSSAFKNGAVSIIKKIGSHAKKSSSQMSGLSKSFHLLKQALSGILIYQGISKVFQAIVDGMQNLSQVSPVTNKSMSMLMTSLTYLKNSFAVAFSPILTIVAPLLSSFMDMLSSAADKVAQFFTALTGKTSYTKAIKVQQDYAKSIADTTKATDKNTKATEENQKSVAGYDELNVMQQDSSSTSSPTQTDTAISPTDMFTTANISKQVSGFAKQLKDLFNNQDFTGIGVLIGNKINGALESIDWNKIRSTASKWAKNIADFFNGSIDTINWELVGSTFGNGIMTVFDFAYTFLNTFDFIKFGKSIANTLNGLFKTLDFKKIGKTFGGVIQSIIDTAFGFVTTFHFAQAGVDLSDAVNNFFSSINWVEAATTVSEGIKGILDTLINFFANTDWEKIGQDIADFIINIDWLGVLEKILQAIAGIFSAGTDIMKGIISKCPILALPLAPFLGLIFLGDLFQGDTSTLEWLKKVAQDLFNGFVSALNGVVPFFQNLWKEICKVFEYIGQWCEAVFGGAWQDICNIFSGVGKWFSDVFTGAWNGICNAFSSVGNFFKSVWNSICKVFSNIGKWFSDVFNGCVNAIKDVWDKLTGFFKALWEGIWNVMKIPINWIIDGINSLWTGIYNAVKGIVDSIGGVAGALGSIFGQDWSFSMPANPPLIPKLATGTVVPASYGEYLAVLGDNKREPEVVSPLSTMKQALAEVMSEFGGAGGGDINITLQLGDDVVAKHTVKWNDRYKKTHGKSAFA